MISSNVVINEEYRVLPLNIRIVNAFSRAYNIQDDQDHARQPYDYFLGFPKLRFLPILLYICGGFLFTPLKNTIKLIIEFLPKTIELFFAYYADLAKINNQLIASVLLRGTSYIFKCIAAISRAVISPINSFKEALLTGDEVKEKYGSTAGQSAQIILGGASLIISAASLAVSVFYGVIFGLSAYMFIMCALYPPGDIHLDFAGNAIGGSVAGGINSLCVTMFSFFSNVVCFPCLVISIGGIAAAGYNAAEQERARREIKHSNNLSVSVAEHSMEEQKRDPTIAGSTRNYFRNLGVNQQAIAKNQTPLQEIAVNRIDNQISSPQQDKIDEEFYSAPPMSMVMK